MDHSENFVCQLIKTLQENGDKTCLAVSNKSINRRKFHEMLTAAINLLKWKGLSPNDRVLITINPSIEFYTVAVAALAIGGVLVMMDPSMGMERCDHCIATAKPTIWVWQRGSKLKFLKYLLPSIRRIPLHLEVGSLDLPDTSKELFSAEEVEPVENALVTFTTGSTGMPKLLLRRHSFLMNQSRSLSMTYELLCKEETKMEEEDIVICSNLPVFPLHYLKVGATCVLFPLDRLNVSEALKLMARHDVTGVMGSPAFLQKLALQAERTKTMLPVLYSGVGGAPVYKKLLRTVCGVTPGKKTFVVYGSTEAEPISAIFAQEKMALESGDHEGHCVGKPVFSGSVKVIQVLDGPIDTPVDIVADYELAPYQIGELLVSGWHVNTYQVPAERLVTDVNGTVWLRIEDAGYLDDEGRVWLVGRVKWMVERGGQRFWSTVIEQKLLDRCSKVSYATYLNHRSQAWLFLEAPDGLPVKEQAGIKSYLSREGVPVDHMKVMKHIPKDRRHRSKPDTSALFNKGNPNSPLKLLRFVMRSNPLLSILVLFLQLFLILCVIVIIFTH